MSEEEKRKNPQAVDDGPNADFFRNRFGAPFLSNAFISFREEQDDIKSKAGLKMKREKTTPTRRLLTPCSLAPALMRAIHSDRTSRFFARRSRVAYCRAFSTRSRAMRMQLPARPRKPEASLRTAFLCIRGWIRAVRWFFFFLLFCDATSSFFCFPPLSEISLARSAKRSFRRGFWRAVATEKMASSAVPLLVDSFEDFSTVTPWEK